MAVKTFMLKNSYDGTTGSGTLADGVDQTAQSIPGWVVAKNASGLSGEWLASAGQLTFTSQTTSPKPSGLILTGLNNSNTVQTVVPLTGTFAAGNWALHFAVRATVASSQAGRIRLRVYRSVNQNGSGATEITSSTQVGATVILSTTADVDSLITWSAPAITISNEYLFFAIAWEITTQSGNNSSNVQLRTGQSSAGTRIVTTDLPTAAAASLVAPHGRSQQARQMTRWY